MAGSAIRKTHLESRDRDPGNQGLGNQDDPGAGNQGTGNQGTRIRAPGAYGLGPYVGEGNPGIMHETRDPMHERVVEVVCLVHMCMAVIHACVQVYVCTCMACVIGGVYVCD